MLRIAACKLDGRTAERSPTIKSRPRTRLANLGAETSKGRPLVQWWPVAISRRQNLSVAAAMVFGSFRHLQKQAHRKEIRSHKWCGGNRRYMWPCCYYSDVFCRWLVIKKCTCLIKQPFCVVCFWCILYACVDDCIGWFWQICFIAKFTCVVLSLVFNKP